MTNKKIVLPFRLAGRWESEEQDSSAVFEVALKGQSVVVTGFDKRDGERFRISQVEWDGKALSFNAVMPSTRWRSWHRLTPTGRGVVDHRLTIVERWKKTEPSEADASRNPGGELGYDKRQTRNTARSRKHGDRSRR